MRKIEKFVIGLVALSLTGCLGGPEDSFEREDDTAPGAMQIEDLEKYATSNPAPFDLHCLWLGESYASKAPNQYAAQAIRNACEIQAALIPYKAPGMWPHQLRLPTAAEGIDCSGLTSNVYYRATSGFVALPHSAASQEAMLPYIGLWSMLPGDLIFYSSASAASGRHVAMYIGDGLMIEASGSNVGVVVGQVRAANMTSIRRVVQ